MVDARSSLMPLVDNLRRRGMAHGDIVRALQNMRDLQAATGINQFDPMQRLYGSDGGLQGQPAEQGGMGGTPTPPPSARQGAGPERETVPGTFGLVEQGNPPVSGLQVMTGDGEGMVPRGQKAEEAQQQDRPRPAPGGKFEGYGQGWGLGLPEMDPDRARTEGDTVMSPPGGRQNPGPRQRQPNREALIAGARESDTPTPPTMPDPIANMRQQLEREPQGPNGERMAPGQPASTGGADRPRNPAASPDQTQQSPQGQQSTETSDDIRQQRDQGGGAPVSDQENALPQPQTTSGGGQDNTGLFGQLTNAASNLFDGGGQDGQQSGEGFMGVPQDAWNQLMQFGLQTMAAGGKPGATTLGALGRGGLAAQQQAQKQDRRQFERQMAERQEQRQQERLELAQQEAQREETPRVTAVQPAQSGSLVAVMSDGSVKDLGVQAQRSRDLSPDDAISAAKEAATQQVLPTGPDGQPIPQAEPIEKFDQRAYNQTLDQLGYGNLSLQSGDGMEAADLPLTGDGALDTDQLQQGKTYQRNGRRAVFAGMQNGKPQWVPVGRGQ